MRSAFKLYSHEHKLFTEFAVRALNEVIYFITSNHGEKAEGVFLFFRATDPTVYIFLFFLLILFHLGP